ncbi:MAG: ABC transporter ATP-binding protein [Clostridiales bacterium]|nr:ABC transporter ATP-binding protein [Clostridiales bacterium]
MARQFSGKRPKDLRNTLRVFLSYLGRHKFLLILVSVLAAVSALANLLGTYMIKPIVNQITAEDGLSGLISGVVIAAVIYGIGAFSSLGYTQIMVRAAQKILLDIRHDLFSHSQSLPLSFFDKQLKGNLMSLFTNDVDTISEALNDSLAMLIQSAVQLFGTIALLFILNWQLSILVIVGYGAMFLYIRFSTKKSKIYFNSQQAVLGELDGYIEEMTSGQKVVKAFNRERENLRGFSRLNERLREAGTNAQGYAATMVPAIVSISYINYAVIAVLGGMMVIAGQSDIGSLASYLVFVRQSAMPINQFTQKGNFLLASLAGAERIFKILKEPSEVDDGKVERIEIRLNKNKETRKTAETIAAAEKTTTLKTAEKTAAAEIAKTTENTAPSEKVGAYAWRYVNENKSVPLRGEVKFEGVSFGYENDRDILKNISLTAEPGQKIAFVGSTGAGKTTIINLLSRFYDVTEGVITFDGIDIRDIRKKDLRRSMSVVLQDTHLFTGTVADNIRFGKPDASNEEVKRAAETANADSFISRLPKGYNTLITGDGENLSQGQRQLLAIARAAVADPSILILDEATSSVDTRTEALIEKGMDRLMKGRTVFIIAHRLSTVRNADKIIVLEHGEIAESGNHEELLRARGIYYKLCSGLLELS